MLCLALKIYGDILPFITNEILGRDDIPSRSLQTDALGELINVVCGNYLPDLCNSCGVFNIAPPQVLEQETTFLVDAHDSDKHVELGLADGRAVLEVELVT